uniref:Acyl-CoA dehydrogenase family member 9 n=1 Tax=Hirondellea gigas TaxID=1518452 RepID=A0A2P2I242_9CRUS
MQCIRSNLCQSVLWKSGSVSAVHRRPVSSSTTQDTAQVQIKPVDDGKFHPLQTPLKKKGKLEPFVKNLFLGRFDRSVLTFPEALDKERHTTLHEMIVPIEKFFLEDVDSSAIDRTASIPAETMQQLKDMGLFGMQVPEEYGGLGLGATEFSRLGEVTALDGGVAVTLSAHQSIGFKGIMLSGSEFLKRKYLPRLASGELIAAFCLTESCSGSDAASIQTRARLSEDGDTWLLSGTKIFISNGGIADVMTVFARTEIMGEDGKPVDKITAFFVERSFGGVTSGKPEDKMGIRGSNTTEVNFDNTPIPSENIIGELGKGFKLAVTILNSGRFTMGSSTAGVLKRCLGHGVEHAVTRKQFGNTLAQFGLIKQKFAEAAISIYAMESMAYLSAGIIDTYEEQDTAVEAAIVKVYSSRQGWIVGSDLLQVLGGLGYMKDLPYERYLRDSRIMAIFEGTNEILRMFIALMGIQHAAPELKEAVKKLRNPFMNPNYIVKTFFREFRDRNDNPKLIRDLPGHLHPSLELSANSLDYCVERFRYSVQLILVKYGADVVQPRHQMDVVRLGDMAMDLFAMTSVLSRASRAYCIGLHNSQHEILLANTFCKQAEARIKRMVGELQYRGYNCDEEYTQIAENIFSKGGYAAEHPLTKNGW